MKNRQTNPVSIATLILKSIKEFIAIAKAKPGKVSYASSGSGGGPHIAAEVFEKMAGVVSFNWEHNAVNLYTYSHLGIMSIILSNGVLW